MSESPPPLSMKHLRRLMWGWSDDRPMLADVGAHMYIHMDPAEGYAHDVNLVRETFLACSRRFPLPLTVTVVTTPFDSSCRQNAETHNRSEWNKKDEHGRGALEPIIIMFGKRIPPHPAMTRYLVAHEYGHVVAEAVARRLYTDGNPQEPLAKAYREMRGLEVQGGNGAGEWHSHWGEVFANDFRLLVCGVESEFWPHPGIKRPDEDGMGLLREWWVARTTEAIQ